ncbi:MAG: recombinase family protein [Bacillota bacterium]
MIAIYARQSIEKKDSISIESQIAFAKRELTDEPFTIFSDSGYSGKHTNRPAFSHLVTEIKSGDITKVIVYRLDRISRSLVDFADFMDILEAHHVTFVSATEKFDTASPMGRAMLYIIVIFAQLERETIAERVKDNYYSRVRQGAWGGGPAPFGFELVRKEVNEKKVTQLLPTEKIEIAKRIFELYALPHTTLSDVQKQLDDEMHPTKSWNTSKLSSLLKNPVYVKADATIYEYYKNQTVEIANELDDFQGEFACQLIGKRTEPHMKLLSLAPHKGTIESHIFLRCQEKLQNNRQVKNQFRGTHSYLTGLLQCGHCGYSFSVKKGKTLEGETLYFSCSGKYLHKCCHEKQTHRVTEVEAIVAKELTNHIRGLTLIVETEKNSIDETEKIERQLESKINCLLESLSEAPESTKAYILGRIATLHEEKSGLRAEAVAVAEVGAGADSVAVAGAGAEVGTDAVAVASADSVADAVASAEANTTLYSCSDFDFTSLSFSEKKELARLLLKKVVLKKNEIHIVLKTPTNRT